MRLKPTEHLYRAFIYVLNIVLAVVTTGCTHRLYAPLQSDGWSAQPISVECRFASDADLDTDTNSPVGDEGYYLYILNEHANWDYSTASSLVFTIWLRPWAHSWLILESPFERLEFGHTGDLGIQTPRYHQEVFQGVRAGAPDPVAHLWQTRSDGQFQTGKPDRTPTFVWRMPITGRRHQLIHAYIMQRTYGQFGIRDNNCTDLVAEVAALAGIHLIHRIRLTLPEETNFLGRTRRVWTDPHYRILEYGTPEVLDSDLRQLARLGIGSDVTEWYLGLK